MKVYYNGVTLSRVMTKKWEEVVRYDETGVNTLGSTIRMTFEASVMDDAGVAGTDDDVPGQWLPSVPPYIATAGHGIDSGTPEGGHTTSSNKLKQILRDLQIPRCAFRVYNDVSGAPIFEAYPEAIADYSSGDASENLRLRLNMDVNNGPKPISVSVISVIGGYYLISFEIEVTKIRCFGGEAFVNSSYTPEDPSTGIVISHRCWTEESLDNNFYLTRTYQGKLTASANSKTVHSHRNLFYPPLEVGFRRESVKFSESQDGLSLSYIVTDKQVRNSVPYPATQFSGSVQYSIVNMVQESAVLQLTVVGAPYTPRKKLLAVARLTMGNKIVSIKKALNNGRADNFNIVVTKFDIAENLGDPPSFTLTVQLMIYVNAQETSSPGSEDTSASAQSTQNTENNTVPQYYNKETFSQSGFESSFNMAERLAVDSIAAIEISESFKNRDGSPMTTRDEYNYWTYDRKKSSKPNPYGYNVYEVYDSQDKKDNDEYDRTSFGFIKQLASAPCVMPALRMSADAAADTGMGSGGIIVSEQSEGGDNQIPSSDLTTKVERTSDIKVDTTSPTGLTSDALNFPYTLYKSHAVYTANYHRAVKPRYFTSKNSENFAEPTIVDVAPPEGRYLVTIEAERLNQLPELPDPEEILTVANVGEAQGGVNVTSSTSSSSEPNPTPQPTAGTGNSNSSSNSSDNVPASSNTTIDNYCSGIRSSEPVKFYCLNNAVQIAEPKPSLSGGGTMYTVLATYEYATSRPLRKGDEVRLLLNPLISQSKCYYPRAFYNDNSSITVARRPEISPLYNGNVLNHMPPSSN